MPEPSSAALVALTTAGISILGIATGLHPELLLAGVVGSLWALSYSEPLPVWRRCAITAVTSVVAGYLTPATIALLRISAWIPAQLTQELVMPPAALLIGFLAHKVLGPAITRLGAKITDNQAK